ncbi:hypothetical protein [Chromatium okenii]|uniref:Uncharacterized protein n=1 Tax=Chromatium okenii TaxID=61644 RepID=A0A2S7XNU6_9GAMM|nr:hypothetical protein [Chromatium okenii]PQJ95417.1 hypothetical protein CXB77_14485 [Chromatium okenii]
MPEREKRTIRSVAPNWAQSGCDCWRRKKISRWWQQNRHRHAASAHAGRSTNHAMAAAQYRALSRWGDAGALYFPVKGGTVEEFAHS